MSKTCDNCGCKVYSHGCVNCDESEYISMQEGYAELYPEPEQQQKKSFCLDEEEGERCERQCQPCREVDYLESKQPTSELEREKLIDKLKDIHAANGNVFDIADFILEREKEKDAEIERLNQEVESLTVTVKTLNKELTSWHGKAKELEAENERLKGEREKHAIGFNKWYRDMQFVEKDTPKLPKIHGKHWSYHLADRYYTIEEVYTEYLKSNNK